MIAQLKFDEARGLSVPTEMVELRRLIRSYNETILGSSPRTESAEAAGSTNERVPKHDTKDKSFQIKCYNCGTLGHISRNCKEPDKRKKNQDVKVTPEPTKNYKMKEAKKQQEAKKAQERVNTAEFEDILETFAIGTCLGTTEDRKLYLDTGASSHFIKDADLLST